MRPALRLSMAEMAGDRPGDLGEQRDDADAAAGEIGDRLGDARMIGGDDGEHVDPRAERRDVGGDGRGRDIVDELDHRASAQPREAARRARQRRGELAIEFVAAPLQEKAEALLGRRLVEPAAQETGAVIADRLGGGEHAGGGVAAHGGALVEHAVHRRHADAGRPRHIGDGRPPPGSGRDGIYHARFRKP